MSDKQTFFNPEWEDSDLYPQWSPWLKSVPGSPTIAKCTYCNFIIRLSNMGRQAITSHTTSGRHKKFLKSKKSAEKFNNFFTKDSVAGSSSISNVSVQKSSIESFVTKDDVLSAELVWAMKLVFSHISYNSFNDAAAILQKMFGDSNKAKSVTLGRTKMAYLVSFGLAPYFKNHLISLLKDTEYVICFDEALNKIIQRGQMDIYVRFWDLNKEEVSTRYLSSIFLGHATANDLLRGFFEGISELDKKKLLQVSLDGPNVNLKFLRDLRECLINEEDSCNLLDIGSCGLHVVHGAFRTGHGATGWHLNELFKDMHRLFKNSPARRADYISITGVQSFPLKFCDVRWCENIRVAEKAIEVFANVKKFIESTKLPHTVSVDRLKEAFKDKLILAKISFFISISNVLYPFLKTFQSAEPKCPFLYNAFHSMLLQLMSKFLKREVLREATTPQKLMKIDCTDPKNYCNVVEVDIGIGASANLAKSGASDALKKEFKIECRTFLIKVTLKILERSPFKYNLVKYLSALDPSFIASNETLAEKRMEGLLKTLFENMLINSVVADKAKMQFKELLFRSKEMWKDTFIKYSSSMRLDHFYRDLINNSEFTELWKVLKTVLILSHGNATVESGFSINKDMLVENLLESSLIALRTVYDGIKANEGVLNVNITPDMLKYARSARSVYHQALEEKKNSETKEKNILAEKRKAKTQIKLLELKKQKLNKDVSLEVSNINSQIAELRQKI